ncbi:MAG: winged helix-turn-helix domain-containing protein [Candidatus Nitrosocaldus sp.]|nr:winged helix-turn-helix domain-containing protein [Candidatus Nitrosocaldus sp.]
MHRSSFRIIGDVLNIARAFGRDGVNITHMLRSANMPYNRFVKVAEQLVRAGLIEERVDEGTRKYIITEKGIEYLKSYESFKNVAEAFGLDL